MLTALVGVWCGLPLLLIIELEVSRDQAGMLKYMEMIMISRSTDRDLCSVRCEPMSGNDPIP